MTSKKIQPTTWLFVAIMALAFVLRMGWPTLVEFKRDEATVARQAQAIAYEGYLPAIGVDSSVGIDNLPLTLYLMAIPLRFWKDPLAAVIFTLLLNSLAVVGCYWLGKACFHNKWVGLIAAFLFAVNPWAILYARKIWCRTMPLFTLAFIASLVAAFVWHKKWALVGAFVSLAALLGLQLEGLAFVPIFGLVLLLYYKDIAWKPFLVGTAVFVLLMLPYGIHDMRNGWDNLRGLLSYTGGGEATFSWDALRYALMLTGSAGIEGQAGAFHPEFHASVPNLWWLNGFMMVLTVLSLVYAVYQSFRAPAMEQRRIFTLLSLWFWVPLATQLRPGADPQLHYFVTHYPVQFLLVAVFLVAGAGYFKDRLGSLKLAQLNIPVYSLVLVLVLALWGGWQTAVAAQRLHFMVSHPSTGGYGIPLYYTRQAAQAAQELAGEAEIIVLNRDTRPLSTETPTVFDALLFGHPHRFSDARWVLPLPENGDAVYLLGPVQEPVAADLQLLKQRLESFDSVSFGPVTTLPDGMLYRTYYHQGPDREDVLAGMTLFPDGIPFANKVIIAGYELPGEIKPGQSLNVWLAWWLQGTPPAADYHFTAQLLDSSGGLRSQHDHAGFPSDMWRAGDLVLSYFSIPVPDDLPSGVYNVRVGMYTYPDIATVPVVDAAGSVIDSGVTLDTFSVVE